MLDLYLFFRKKKILLFSKYIEYFILKEIFKKIYRVWFFLCRLYSIRFIIIENKMVVVKD